MILPPMVLGIDPDAVLPSGVLQSYFNGSSDLRTEHVVGIGTSQTPRLFCNVHVPDEPSLKDIAIAVMGSLVRDAHPIVLIANIKITIHFIQIIFFVVIKNLFINSLVMSKP